MAPVPLWWGAGAIWGEWVLVKFRQDEINRGLNLSRGLITAIQSLKGFKDTVILRLKLSRGTVVARLVRIAHHRVTFHTVKSIADNLISQLVVIHFEPLRCSVGC